MGKPLCLIIRRRPPGIGGLGARCLTAQVTIGAASLPPPPGPVCYSKFLSVRRLVWRQSAPRLARSAMCGHRRPCLRSCVLLCEHELDMLERALDEARAQLRVVDVVAEPGMGKSRLLHEFRQRIGKDCAFVVMGSCSPDGQQTPFLPFIEVVRSSFRVSAGEAEQDVAQKIEMGLTALGLHPPRNLGLLLHLLGLKFPHDALAGTRWHADRTTHAGAFAATTRGTLPSVAGGPDDRGFALDRQRLGGVAEQDH